MPASRFPFPNVDELLEQAKLKSLVGKLNQNVVVAGIRSFLGELSGEVREAAAEMRFPNLTELAERIAQRILAAEEAPLTPVINATGMLFHPELGGPPLADAAWEAAAATSRDYASLGLDDESGRLRLPNDAVGRLAKEVLGAEAAFVCQHPLGAVHLALAALAGNGAAALARGHVVDVFAHRSILEIAHTAGVRIVEVGRANATGLADFEALKDHGLKAAIRIAPADHRTSGANEQPALSEWTDLAREKGWATLVILPSATAIDLVKYGLGDQPHIQETLAAGVDLVVIAGDRLLGGPPSGVVLGAAKYIERIEAHPLAAAMQASAPTFAALAATLQLYRDPRLAIAEIPLLQLLDTSVENLRNRAERLAVQFGASTAIERAEPFASHTFLTGHALSAERLPTWCIALTAKQGAADRLAATLRTARRPVVARVEGERVVIDLRTVLPRQERELVETVQGIEK